MNHLVIKQSTYTPELKQKLIDGLSEHAFSVIGLNPWVQGPIAFEITDGDNFVGGIALDLFHNQIHVKQIFVDDKYRGQGIGTKLMQHAFEFAKTEGCSFIFLETLSYQALDFYKKLGFKIDLVRGGFEHGISMIYLSKELSKI